MRSVLLALPRVVARRSMAEPVITARRGRAARSPVRTNPGRNAPGASLHSTPIPPHIKLCKLWAAVCCLWFSAAGVDAQQVTVSTPYHSVGESFFEHMGTTWGLRGKNWFFNFGAPYAAAPPFGGFDPSAGGNLGFGFQQGGVNGFFGGNFSQGLRRSFVSRTPSVTLGNGLPGYVSDSSWSPFVISYVPVVGGFPTLGAVHPVPPPPARAGPSSLADNPAVVRTRTGQDGLTSTGGRKGSATAGDVLLDESARKLAAARASSAGRPAVSVDQARRLYAREQLEQRREVLVYLERARGAENAGKANVARVYYQMAYRRASGGLRDQIRTRLKALETASQGK